MTKLTSAKGGKAKKVPCEECRDQKRKCNGESPCERCHKFNLCCVYTTTRSPRDEEFIELARQAALVTQIETMENQIKDMETLMKEMSKNNQNSCDSMSSPSNSIPPLVMDDSDKSISSYEDTNSIACLASIPPNIELRGMHLLSPPTKRTKLIASSGSDAHAYITSTPQSNKTKGEEKKSQAAPWTLTFEKGNMRIQTHITSHTDLLDNLHHMIGTIELMPQIPPNFSSAVRANSLIGILNQIIRKKYGKTHCKNVARSVRIFMVPDTSEVNTLVVAQSPDTIETTTMKLLRAYLRCQHLQQLAIHARTFIRLFVDNTSTRFRIEDSPAAMALCAAICTMRCKHVAECLPSISLVEYGKFYFERARDLVSDLFDVFDLETVTSYTFMTIYKLAVSHTEEALTYADLAERISLELEPHYNAILRQKNSTDGDETAFLLRKGEAVHFSRLRNHLHRVQTYEQISRVSATATKQILQNDKDLPFCTLIHMGEGSWEIAEDDSVQEKWFAEMHGYILRLQRAEHEASRAAQSCDLYHLVSLIGHQVEMAIRYWYYKVLPPEFRLTLPLFDSNVGCKEYFTTLERECAHSAIPVLTTLALYEEWIVLSQSYLPKSVPAPENDWRLLNEVWRGGPQVHTNSAKWKRRVDKLMDLRRLVDFEGTDQEYLIAINSMLGPTETRVDTNIIILGLHASFNTIRLVKFLRSRAADCYFDMRVLLNAWQFLLTVSKLQELMPTDVLTHIPRVHKNLSKCMAIVQDELKLQPFQGKVSDYVAEMERDLKSQVINDDDCDCFACPNA